jgi:hypothetical protein
MMKVARLAAAAQCANAPEGTAPSAQVHAEGFEQALRVLRAACRRGEEVRQHEERAIPRANCAGVVQSLARPGGNLTGFTNFEPSIASKERINL